MLKRILKHFAKKSHNVQVQLLLATLYGLIDLFGLGGTILILNKARKMAKKKACNRVTAKPTPRTNNGN